MSTCRVEHNTPTICASVPVAIYTRVSTDGQVGHRFDSCEHQAEVCRDYIRKHEHSGWYEVACYTDQAYSGGTIDRPGIRALMGDIRAGLVKIVLIYKLERILRSTYEWSQFSRFLEEYHCRLISPTEDLSDTSASGKLKTNILMSFAEYERLNVSEKTRSKMLAQAQRGMWGGGVVPFGYSHDRESHRLLPITAEAEIVRRIYGRAASLVPLGQVALELNDSGLRTRIRRIRDSSGNQRSVGGQPFRADALRLLIKNPIYRGAVRYAGQEFRGQQEALVSVETWELANAAVKEPRRKRLSGRDKYFNLLKGILVCGCCRCPLLSKASGKRTEGLARYRYYSCKRRFLAFTAKKCALTDIAAEPLEKAVVGFLSLMNRHESVVEALTGDGRDASEQRRLHEHQFAALEARLLKLNSQVSNCIDVLAEEGMQAFKQDLSERIMRLGKRRQALLLQREQKRQQLAAFNKDTFSGERIRFALTMLRRLLPTLSPSQLQDLLRLVFESVTVCTGMTPASSSGSARTYQLAFRLRLADLVTAMERGGIIDDRTEKTSPYARRVLTLSAEIVFGPKKRIALCSPFQAEFGDMPPVVVAAPVVQNPIRRAKNWARELSETPSMSMRALARRDGVSAALISLHLKLLQLAPEIVAFVMGLDTVADLRVFSFRALSGMVRSSHVEQARLFNEMRRALQQAECLSLKPEVTGFPTKFNSTNSKTNSQRGVKRTRTPSYSHPPT